jgi:hypothetical protein
MACIRLKEAASLKETSGRVELENGDTVPVSEYRRRFNHALKFKPPVARVPQPGIGGVTEYLICRNEIPWMGGTIESERTER